jgi:acetylornithine deacetylase/succinyl-diaminopimelate desuccinylase-like protein
MLLVRQAILIALLAYCTQAAAEVRSSDFTDPWQVYAHDLLRDSIAFRSYRGEKQVVPLTEFLANEFIETGFPAGDVRILPLDSDGEPAASLVVRFRGESNNKRPILFSAHTDVVGTVESNWDSDPFTLSENDGFYYGRGVLDDKFGTTILTTTFLRLKKEGFTPERDLIIVFSGDEETKQWTIESLVQDHLDLIDAEVAFILDAGEGRLNAQYEPIATFLQFAEKTYVTFELTANNPGGHSSKPPPDNAIADLARAIVAIHEFDFPVRSSVESRAYFAAMSKSADGELGAAMRQFAENPDNKNASDLLTKHREHVGSIRTTCVPTMVRGGHTENVLPETATVTINCRLYPGVSVADTEATLKQVISNPAIVFETLGKPLASPVSPVREDVVALIEAATDSRYPGVPVVPYIAPGGTDGVYLRNGGITSYGLYGLFLRAEDDNSHASNEKLSIEGFYDALDFWYGLTKDLAAL